MSRFLVHLSILPLLLLASCDPRSDVERANEEGILIIGNSNEPKGLDPHLVSGVLESNIIRALFEGLCVEDPSQDGIARPGAAASYEVSEDFTAWTFHLQPDGKWSDGIPVTAHDFVFSYRRLLSPDPNWPAKYAEMLYFIENGENYSKNRRGQILMARDASFPTSWETLSKANFEGDSDLELAAFAEKGIFGLNEKEKHAIGKYLPAPTQSNLEKANDAPFDKLSSEERRLRLNAKGLDALNKKELTYLTNHPEAFVWPDSLSTEAREAAVARLLEYAGKDLWDQARVGVTAIDDFTLEVQLRGPVPLSLIHI